MWELSHDFVGTSFCLFTKILSEITQNFRQIQVTVPQEKNLILVINTTRKQSRCVPPCRKLQITLSLSIITSIKFRIYVQTISYLKMLRFLEVFIALNLWFCLTKYLLIIAIGVGLKIMSVKSDHCLLFSLCSCS